MSIQWEEVVSYETSLRRIHRQSKPFLAWLTKELEIATNEKVDVHQNITDEELEINSSSPVDIYIPKYRVADPFVRKTACMEFVLSRPDGEMRFTIYPYILRQEKIVVAFNNTEIDEATLKTKICDFIWEPKYKPIQALLEPHVASISKVTSSMFALLPRPFGMLPHWSKLFKQEEVSADLPFFNDVMGYRETTNGKGKPVKTTIVCYFFLQLMAKNLLTTRRYCLSKEKQLLCFPFTPYEQKDWDQYWGVVNQAIQARFDEIFDDLL